MIRDEQDFEFLVGITDLPSSLNRFKRNTDGYRRKCIPTARDENKTTNKIYIIRVH